MTDKKSEELNLLAAMAYGEASTQNMYEEMAGIASVLLRQRDARGYETMMAFVKAEPTYSFVVKDGSPRYNELINVQLDNIEKRSDEIKIRLPKLDKQIAQVKQSIVTASAKEKTGLQKQLHALEVERRSIVREQAKLDLHKLAYAAAKNAIDGGVDYSNGAYFWDGKDIKTNYANHFKVKHGIKITDPKHNIYNLANSTKLVIKYKETVRKNKKTGKRETIREEVGRYDHIYESTAGHGGTIFWKHNPEYMKLSRAKEYK